MSKKQGVILIGFFFGLVELDALVSELMHTIFWGEGGLSLKNLLPNIRTIKVC